MTQLTPAVVRSFMARSFDKLFVTPFGRVELARGTECVKFANPNDMLALMAFCRSLGMRVADVRPDQTPDREPTDEELFD